MTVRQNQQPAARLRSSLLNAHLFFLQRAILPRSTYTDLIQTLSSSNIMVKPEATSPPTSPVPVVAVPLDSSNRTTPIHAELAEIKVPDGPLPSYRYHPVTCQPIEPQDYQTELKQLEEEYKSQEDALSAQEQIAREVREKIASTQRKREEVQKSIDKKVKERDTEMKVVSKFQETKVSDIPA